MELLQTIPVLMIAPDPLQPRKSFDESEILALGENMSAHGQHLPVIVKEALDAEKGVRRFHLIDGERRWRAAQLVGIAELGAIVLKEVPTTEKLALIRAGIDIHRSSLRAMERSDLFARLQKETGKSVTELAELLSVSQSVVSKHLALQRLEPSIKAKLDDGTLDLERAYKISQQPDAARQLQLAAVAGTLSRSELSQRAKNKTAEPEPALSNIRMAMPGGFQVSVQGREVTFDLAIELLGETVRMLKKGHAQGLSLASQIKVMRDTAKAPRSAAKATS